MISKCQLVSAELMYNNLWENKFSLFIATAYFLHISTSDRFSGRGVYKLRFVSLIRCSAAIKIAKREFLKSFYTNNKQWVVIINVQPDTRVFNIISGDSSILNKINPKKKRPYVWYEAMYIPMQHENIRTGI